MNNNTSIWQTILSSLKGEEYDYTEGSIRKAIVLLAIPMILELSLESVFAVVDIFYVSSLGNQAIATVGFTESLITIVYSLGIGLSTAITAIVARRVGEKQTEQAAVAAYNGMILCILLSIILGVVGVWQADNLLQFMGADAATVALGGNYTRLVFGLNIVIILLFYINGVFRGAGNAFLAMKSLWIASIINIILDPILIFGIGGWAGMGLEGAAMATIIGRSIGVLYQLNALKSKGNTIKITKENAKILPNIMAKIIKIASPATIQFIVASGSWIVLTRMVANEGGIDAAAGYQIAIRNVIFFILPGWGLSNAAATLVGQNLGANQVERAQKSTWLSAQYNMIFMAFVSFIFIVFPGFIIGIFSDNDVVVKYGIEALQIIGAGYIFYGLGMVMMQALNGAGDTSTPTIINLIGFWVIQIPLAYVLSHTLDCGYQGIMWAIPIAEALIALMAWWVFRRGSWMHTKV